MWELQKETLLRAKRRQRTSKKGPGPAEIHAGGASSVAATAHDAEGDAEHSKDHGGGATVAADNAAAAVITGRENAEDSKDRGDVDTDGHVAMTWLISWG